MRKRDREITNIDEIIKIIKKCDVCSVAFFDEIYPYIVPLNFGLEFESNTLSLYFHCANVGKKLELLRKNNLVAFEMNCMHKLILNEIACNSTMQYESVCGNGSIKILDEAEKIKGLTILMNQYSKSHNYEFNDNKVKSITVLKLTVHKITAKKSNTN